MADLTEAQAAQTVKIVGSSSGGAESVFVEVESNQGIKANIIGKDSLGAFYNVAVDNQGRLITSALTGFGADFAFGQVSTAALTTVAVRKTAYTEQTSNAQRSVASSSANDTSAGTGARQVTIYYLDSTGAGPFEEVVTLNGTTYVDTTATDICFINRMVVTSAGSTLTNAGTITLKAATVGGGATIGTITAGDKQTMWAHHYVPTGKVANVTGIACSHNGTTVGSGGVFALNAQTLGVSTALNIQVSDFVRLYGQSSNVYRNYQSPIIISGPSRLTIFVTPESTSALTYRASIDFFQP